MKVVGLGLRVGGEFEVVVAEGMGGVGEDVLGVVVGAGGVEGGE